jgi:hypothetical protein
MLSRRVIDSGGQLQPGERVSLKMNLEALSPLIETIVDTGKPDPKRVDAVRSALEEALEIL